METPSSSIMGDSCQYTPIYFVEDPNITQTRSYVITQNDSNIQKPVSDSLKKFYENSGKLENNLIHRVENEFKPRILKKQENKISNNLKLVSFILPKREMKTVPCKQVVPQTNNVLLKPVYIANTPNITVPVGGSTPKMDVNSKIVNLKDVPNGTKSQNMKMLPKKKPNTNQSNTRHTSVQLLKLGETYHSLNQLSEQQMKIVNHALKIFSNPQNTPQVPTYDPVTNTKFIYKVVSPKDLTVVGKNNMIFKPKKTEIKKAPIKKLEKKELTEEDEFDQDVDIPVFLENAVTRSGRKVKISKNILPVITPDKPKKKNETISCFQCSSKFSTQYRLQKHYDHHPSHAPGQTHHSNLFNCLLAIVKAGSEENRANMFLQQLEQLIMKIKLCIPCLTKTNEDVQQKSYNVSDEIGRVLDITPGRYKLNMDALNCIKDKNGYCSHNPAPCLENQDNLPQSVLKDNATCDKIEPACVRINSAVKWPTVCKRNESRKQKLELSPSAKKLKLESRIEISDNQDKSQGLLTDDNGSYEQIESDCAQINSAVKWPTVKRIENRNQKSGSSPNAKKLKLGKIETDSVTNDILVLLNKKTENKKQKSELSPNTKILKLDTTIETGIDTDILALLDKSTEDSKQLSEISLSTRNLKSDTNTETDIVTDDIVALFNDNIVTDKIIETKTAETEMINNQITEEQNFTEKEQKKPSHIRFHSAHFDIRSSPIKPSSTTFRTFQINTENMSTFKVQINQPLQLNEFVSEGKSQANVNTPDIFKNNAKKESDHLPFELAKEWTCEEPKTLLKSNNLINDNSIINEDTTDSYMKSDSIQPALIHVKDNDKSLNKEITDLSMDIHLMSDPRTNKEITNSSLDIHLMPDHRTNSDITDSSLDIHLMSDPRTNKEITDSSMDIHLMSDPGHSMDPLNFLETLGNECISYSETDIRNNSVDFHMDLFSFNTT